MSVYAIQIADMVEAILAGNLRSVFRTIVRTPLLQLNPDDLPVLGIYILRERRSPWGDPNAAEIRFIHELTLGISGACAIDHNNREQRAAWLEETMSKIDDLVLKNIPFVRMIEGVTAMDRTAQYAKQSDTTMCEIRVEMTVTFRSSFLPDVPDDFLVMHVETQYPDKAHADAGTQQISATIDIPQN